MTSTNSQPAAGAGATGDDVAHAGIRVFLEQLDHDLRTPLGTMAAAVELLRSEQPGTPSHAETLALLQRQIGRMHSLTETLRNFSQGLAP
jgi:signal transduction histidine kinase